MQASQHTPPALPPVGVLGAAPLQQRVNTDSDDQEADRVENLAAVFTQTVGTRACLRVAVVVAMVIVGNRSPPRCAGSGKQPQAFWSGAEGQPAPTRSEGGEQEQQR